MIVYIVHNNVKIKFYRIHYKTSENIFRNSPYFHSKNLTHQVVVLDVTVWSGRKEEENQIIDQLYENLFKKIIFIWLILNISHISIINFMKYVIRQLQMKLYITWPLRVCVSLCGCVSLYALFLFEWKNMSYFVENVIFLWQTTMRCSLLFVSFK